MAAGDTVFAQGARAQAVFFLAAGKVRLVRHGRAGEDVTIHEASAGEFFAEASLQSDRYHCSAVAVQASDVYALPAGAMKDLLASDSDFALQWVAALSGQLRRARMRVERLCLRSAQERLRHLLLTEGTGPRGSYRLRGTLKDLAAELGITHEALYRTVAAMVRDGVLVRDGTGLSLA
ncbi:MAG: Crp/Fnr family transcriptional regulator [Rubrivivax sp.]|nr:Crp/Fnr family transcriptional regulator [Rubrivivax sp.]